jgi:hypothetical protein
MGVVLLLASRSMSLANSLHEPCGSTVVRHSICMFVFANDGLTIVVRRCCRSCLRDTQITDVLLKTYPAHPSRFTQQENRS